MNHHDRYCCVFRGRVEFLSLFWRRDLEGSVSGTRWTHETLSLSLELLSSSSWFPCALYPVVFRVVEFDTWVWRSAVPRMEAAK